MDTIIKNSNDNSPANRFITKQPKLIALSGAAGSGKSTIAKVFVWERGFKPVKFGACLKSMLSTMLLFAGMGSEEIWECLEGDLKERPCRLLGGKSPRHAMQTMGTEWGRSLLGPNLWVDIWREQVLGHFDKGHNVVVDDLRFSNEADSVRKLGGVIFKVYNPDAESNKMDHVSEQFDFYHDAVITNATTKEALENYGRNTMFPETD